MIRRILVGLLGCTTLIAASHAQGLMDYKRFYSQSEYSSSKAEDLVYGKAKTNYYLYSGSGLASDKANYDLVTQLPLTLDLYNPNTSSNPGKRAVLILIPGGGRTGCLGVDQCNRMTTKQSGLYSSDAYYISQEGTNYNETADSKARTYVKSGFVVLTLNTRYTYHDKRYEANGSNRWFKSNGSTLLSNGSAHLETLVVDIKRAVRWISHPDRASAYNIDPDNIFIQAGSGGSKMASLAAVTATDTLLTDSPSHMQTGDAEYSFEVNHNNLLVPQKAFRGAILFAGDMNGTRHRELITEDTGALMLWHGTKDRSLLHGIAETIEEKCEDVGCATQFYSLVNVQHGAQGAAQYEHTDRASNSGGLKTGVRAHLHDFIVTHLDTGAVDNRPQLSINSSKVKFLESSSRADIEINLSRAVNYPVSVTVAADQTREVMLKNAKLGKYEYIQSYVANDSTTTGPMAYDQGSGVAFENIDNVTSKYAGQTYHGGGPGNGYPVVIPSSSDYFTNDFHGKRQVVTIPAGQTKTTFRVTLLNDGKLEQNECFKVRLLNANGARITNSVENITILDDDNSNAGSSTPEICQNTGGNNGGGGTPTGDDIKPFVVINAPTKSNAGPITDTTIVVEDNEAFVASKVQVRSDNTAGVSNFNCVQTNSKRADCTLRIDSSGDLKIKAEDEAGNITYKKMDGYVITIPVVDDVKPTMVISAPTISSDGPITDTTIVIEDNVSILANKVQIRSDNTAGVSNFNCVQTTSKRVDCTLSIDSSGDLKLKAEDEAGNITYKKMDGYVITIPDDIKPTMVINTPTMSSDEPITDTTIVVEDNDAVLANKVQIRSDNTAGVSNFNCVQTTSKRVDCTLQIDSSGDLKLKAEDEAGNITYKKMDGYIITIPVIDDVKPVVVITAPTKISDNTITDTTISVTDDQAVNASDISILPDTIADVSNFSCSQTSAQRVDCNISILSSGDLKIKAVDQAGNIAYKKTEGYDISPTNAVDTLVPEIVINAPTTISTETITDTTIVVTDDQAVDASMVSIAGNTTADVSDLNCTQTAENRVDCIISISASGDLNIKAEDQAGNIAYKAMEGYEISTPSGGNDIVKATIVINAPTKISDTAITDTTIVVTDDQAIDANKISILGDTTANVSNLLCNQTSNVQVDCTITILSSGDLKLKAEDQAGNTAYKKMEGYQIATTGGGTDNLKSSIVITAPTKISSSTITDTMIVVTDDQAVNANQVAVLADTTAGVSNLICYQTAVERVDCSIHILSSGDLKLRAVDQAGNIAYKKMEGYQVTTPGNTGDMLKATIEINAPTKVSTSAITDTTIVVTDDQAISADMVSILGDTTADVSNLNCNQTSSTRVDCTISISSSGDLKLKARDEAGNISYKKMDGYVIN